MGKITKSIMKGAAAAKKAAEKAKKSMDKADVEMRLEKRKRFKDEAEAKVTPKTGTYTKGTVTATAIREARDANKLDAYKRELQDMPDGLRKQALEGMIDRQIEALEKKQAADVDRASRKSTQANRDRQPFKGYTPTSPFAKGGVVTGKPRTGHADMRGKGLFK